MMTSPIATAMLERVQLLTHIRVEFLYITNLAFQTSRDESWAWTCQEAVLLVADK